MGRAGISRECTDCACIRMKEWWSNFYLQLLLTRTPPIFRQKEAERDLMFLRYENGLGPFAIFGLLYFCKLLSFFCNFTPSLLWHSIHAGHGTQINHHLEACEHWTRSWNCVCWIYTRERILTILLNIPLFAWGMNGDFAAQIWIMSQFIADVFLCCAGSDT